MDRLPLPCDVGEAIVDYLRRGTPTGCVGSAGVHPVRAPHHGLASDGVTQSGRRPRRTAPGWARCMRIGCGISAATSMLAAGASLTEIGQVLRHRGPLTTSIYAKADTAALRALARPWPIGGAL